MSPRQRPSRDHHKERLARKASRHAAKEAARQARVRQVERWMKKK